jgi:hypothetical protein
MIAQQHPDRMRSNPRAMSCEGKEELVEAEADETLIEETEEEAPDVTGIIDAPIEPDEKT